jgi:hypothetical protein
LLSLTREKDKTRFSFFLSLCLSAGPGKPIIAKVGFYFKTISLQESEETFEADLYWWVRVDGITDSVEVKAVSNFEFLNGKMDLFETDQEVLDWEKKYYYATGRCRGLFPFESDYRSFPFDRQRLPLKIENAVAGAGEIQYQFDQASYIAAKEKAGYFGVSELEILKGSDHFVLGSEFRANNIEYKTNFGDPAISEFETYSRFESTVIVGRNPWAFFLKISFPLFVILFLSYLVFYIPPSEISTASALTVTSLLAAIAFQWTISGTLPKVTYLTFSDKLFYMVFIFVFYAMAETILTFNLMKGSERRQRLALRIEKFSRWAFPMGFLLAVFIFVMEARA